MKEYERTSTTVINANVAPSARPQGDEKASTTPASPPACCSCNLTADCAAKILIGYLEDGTRPTWS